MKGLKKSSVQLWLRVFFLWRPGSVFSCSSCLYNEIIVDTLLILFKTKGQGHFHTRESPQCYPPTTQIGSSKIASQSNFWWGKLLRIRFFFLSCGQRLISLPEGRSVILKGTYLTIWLTQETSTCKYGNANSFQTTRRKVNHYRLCSYPPMPNPNPGCKINMEGYCLVQTRTILRSPPER